MIDLNFDSTRPFLVLGRAGMDIYPTPVNTKTAEVTEFFQPLVARAQILLLRFAD